MMKQVVDIAATARGLSGQIAVEGRAMACGMGTCQSCCQYLRAKTGESSAADGKKTGAIGWRARMGRCFWGQTCFGNSRIFQNRTYPRSGANPTAGFLFTSAVPHFRMLQPE